MSGVETCLLIYFGAQIDVCFKYCTTSRPVKERDDKSIMKNCQTSVIAPFKTFLLPPKIQPTKLQVRFNPPRYIFDSVHRCVFNMDLWRRPCQTRKGQDWVRILTVYLQLHCPEGQAQEVPQLQLHPPVTTISVYRKGIRYIAFLPMMMIVY